MVITKTSLHNPLTLASLYRYASDEVTDFSTTDMLEPLSDVINQERAMQALDFAIQMSQKGYNLFAVGPYGTGKKSLIIRWLKKEASNRKIANDWVYVYNFENSNEPIALQIPSSRGIRLKAQIG